jgi:hypothetical protein
MLRFRIVQWAEPVDPTTPLTIGARLQVELVLNTATVAVRFVFRQLVLGYWDNAFPPTATPSCLVLLLSFHL